MLVSRSLERRVDRTLSINQSDNVCITDAINVIPILVPQKSADHVDICCVQHVLESRKDQSFLDKRQVLTCLTVARSQRKFTMKRTCPNLTPQKSAHTRKPKERCLMFVVNVKRPSRRVGHVPSVGMKGVVIVQGYRTSLLLKIYRNYH